MVAALNPGEKRKKARPQVTVPSLLPGTGTTEAAVENMDL